MKNQQTDVEILNEVKTDMRNMGKVWVESFNNVNTIVATRGANMSYRCVMQAIRDKVRFHNNVK